MTDDSELESLQCYPFHLPESGGLVFRPKHESDPVEVLRITQDGQVYVDGEPIDIDGIVEDMKNFYISRALEDKHNDALMGSLVWDDSRSAEIIGDLPEAAGIPPDEAQGGGYASTI